MKTSNLTGRALAYAVGIAEGCKVETWHAKSVAILFHGAPRSTPWNPHEDWSQGGPIIDRERISVVDSESGTEWNAEYRYKRIRDDEYWSGPTPLIAAMRCYVASKLGEEIEIPEELK